MRHRVAHRKLGRVTEHRIALLRNQAQALLRHERIQTTVPKAKELRPFVERIITIAKRSQAPEGSGTGLQARRMVTRDIHDPAIVGKLFDTIAPRFAGRPGGYTRLLRLGHRRGDSADIALVELVGSEFNPKAEAAKSEKVEQAKATGVTGRLRAAAQRLRGKKTASTESEDRGAAEKKAPKRTGGRKGSEAASKSPGKKAT